MKRPDEEQLLQQLGLTKNEARIVFGAGINADMYVQITSAELWQRLWQLPAWSVVSSILSKKRLMTLKTVFSATDQEYWNLFIEPAIGKFLIKEKVPFWWVFLEASLFDLLAIPGIGRKKADALLQLRSDVTYQALIEQYLDDEPDMVQYIVVTPTFSDKEGELLDSLLMLHANNIPLEGEYIWVFATDIDTHVVDIINLCESGKLTVLYFALQEDASEDAINTVEKLIDRIYWTLPFTVRIYILWGKRLQYIPHRIEGGNFAYSLKGPKGEALGLTIFDVVPGAYLLDVLYDFPPIAAGGEPCTVTGFDILREDLFVTRP